MKAMALGILLAQGLAFQTAAQSRAGIDSSLAKEQFNRLCRGCHGDGGAGGDRAPALLNNRGLRERSESQIAEIIKNGMPGGMPGFSLPADKLQSLAGWVRSLNVSAFDSAPGGDAAAGKRFFFDSGRCGTCHMVHGRGEVGGPDLSDIGRKSTLRELELVLDNPTSQMGVHTTPTCPSWAFCPDEVWAVVDVRLRNGSRLRGFARNRSEHDLQMETFDGKMHLLVDKEYEEITKEKQSYMPPLRSTPEERRNLIAYLSSLGGNAVGPLTFEADRASSEAVSAVANPAAGEWPTYNGIPGGNRHSGLTQINRQSVKDLKVEWVHSLAGSGLETTPIVSGGIMYVTSPGAVCALDSRTGSEIWCYSRSTDRTQATPGGAGGTEFVEPNRGVALLGDRVFFCDGRCASGLSPSPDRRCDVGYQNAGDSRAIQRDFCSFGGG